MDTETERLNRVFNHLHQKTQELQAKIEARYGPAKGRQIVDAVTDIVGMLRLLPRDFASQVVAELPAYLALAQDTQRQIDGTVDPVVQALDNLNGDPESDHGTAEDLVLGQLRELGRSDIADAFTRARGRVGFWYA